MKLLTVENFYLLQQEKWLFDILPSEWIKSWERRSEKSGCMIDDWYLWLSIYKGSRKKERRKKNLINVTSKSSNHSFLSFGICIRIMTGDIKLREIAICIQNTTEKPLQSIQQTRSNNNNNKKLKNVIFRLKNRFAIIIYYPN